MQLSDKIKEAFFQYADVCLEGGYILDHENTTQVNQVLELFEKNQGICLQGNSGSGKTFIMEVLKRITHPKSKRHFVLLDTFQIVKYYNDNYEELGDRAMSEWNEKNILINELGVEEKGKYQSEVMQKFILFRHKLWERTKRKTHFTTNLTDQEIAMRYGSFTHSRITAMCHTVQLGAFEDSTDRRPLRNFKAFPFVVFPPSDEEIRNREYWEGIKKHNQENPTKSEFKSSAAQMKEYLDRIAPKK